MGASGVNLPLTLRNLESLVTNNGYDTSGDHSSLYAVIYGDPRDIAQQNNGVFKVVDLLNDDTDTPNATYYESTDTTKFGLRHPNWVGSYSNLLMTLTELLVYKTDF